MNIETEKDGVKTFYAKDRNMWREWLENHHHTEKNLWLIIFKKESNIPSVYYDEAVDEALCFGWIDSKINKRNEESFYQFFAKRNPKSNWSKVNKEKVEKLLNQNLMQKAGLDMVDLAKKTGTWNALDEVELLKIPDDMLILLEKNKIAYQNFQNFPRSVKRGILEWIHNAKQASTRLNRIQQTIELAEKNERANQYIKK